MPYGRVPKGQALNIACVTCHDLRHGGIDPSTVPGNTSLGGTWDNVNATTIFNDAFRPLLFWASRADSLWAQPPGSIEASMGSNRLRAVWTIATYYAADYSAVFTDWPLQMTGTIADLSPTLETSRQPGRASARRPLDVPWAVVVVSDSTGAMNGCFPRFPLDGKPGSKAGCQPGDASEPYGDAWDCMDSADQTAVIRMLVNFGKALAAFEARLISRNSAFDQFIDDLNAGRANESSAISPAAKNGARLFVGKAGCSDCHNGPLLSDESFYNIGIPQTGQGIPTMQDCPKGGVCDCVTPNNCLPFGAFDGNQKLRNHKYLRTSMWSDDSMDTSRAKYLSLDPNTIPKGSWRTPSLRDVALTAPYMHTGALPDAGIRGRPLQRRRAVARQRHAVGTNPAALPHREEQSQLVEFLKTLTGEPLPSELADPPQLP